MNVIQLYFWFNIFDVGKKMVDVSTLVTLVSLYGLFSNSKQRGAIEMISIEHTVFDLISGLSAYVILGPKNRPN